MQARSYRPEDHEVIAEWWKGHGWPVIPPPMLPRTGIIVDGYCAGFLYRTDSAVAIFEWIVANPASDKIERAKALDTLIEAALAEAKSMGAVAVFTMAKHPKLLSRYEQHGFQRTDEGMTHMVRRF